MLEHAVELSNEEQQVHAVPARKKNLASSVVHFFANQRKYVLAKFMEVLLSILTIYPSLIGIVDGLNRNKFFSSEHTILPSTTTAKTVTAGTHLALISNIMSTAVSGVGLTAKVAAHHADPDREKTINYEDIPTVLPEHYTLKKQQVDIFRKSNLKPYHKILTTDKHNTV